MSEKKEEVKVEEGITKPQFSDYWINEDGTPRETTYTPSQYDPTKSTVVEDARTALNTALSQKPVYTSAWENQIADILGQIQTRDKFSYDVNGDALYQQYKDKYIQQGKLAMQDTIGQAAAMTGGYGNSYAAAVGNQAYQAQLNNLNDIIPELYQMAYDRHNQETQDLYNKYALYVDRENTDYAKHRDKVTDWQNNVDYLAGRYDSERSHDYANWRDNETAKQEQWNADYSNAWDKYTKDYNEYVLDSTPVPSGLTPSEWNAIIENAAIYAESGEDSLNNYLNGLVNRDWLEPDESVDILDQYFPLDALPPQKRYSSGRLSFMEGRMENTTN